MPLARVGAVFRDRPEPAMFTASSSCCQVRPKGLEHLVLVVVHMLVLLLVSGTRQHRLAVMPLVPQQERLEHCCNS